MSELGQKQTSRSEIAMSALPPKAAIAEHDQDVRFVPIADIGQLHPEARGSIYLGADRRIGSRSKIRKRQRSSAGPRRIGGDRGTKSTSARFALAEPCGVAVTHCRFDNHDCRPRKRNVGDDGKAVGHSPPTALLI
jgi:hypothetical protein